MNAANRLTLSRIPLTFVLMVVLSWERLPFRFLIGLCVFLIACWTDYWDGVLARRLRVVTPFGVFFDPITDKILVGGAFICLVGLGQIPAWAVVLLLSREFAVTGLRLVSADQKVVLGAERGGKLKTFFHCTTIVYILARLSLLREWHVPLPPITAWEVTVLIGISLVLSVWTGATYFFKNAKLFNP